ncbi:MAG: hypothetical protein AWU57_618 [Marinobacter sp. T13-3]|nr:MAG: hypothetical protein AWU57_618 [Marinobacter sp. T13-3]
MTQESWIKTFIALFVIAVTALPVYIASSYTDTVGGKAQEQKQKQKQEQAAAYERNTIMITLEDGTPCAVLVGLVGDSLDCNWKDDNPREFGTPNTASK